MKFRKYQHVERLGTDEVDGIEFGKCYVFYKIDGANTSVWVDGNKISGGSRSRELSLENDHAGFLAHIVKNKKVISYLKKHPNHRLYGEWLVPHSLKTYRDDAWKRFYVFDVTIDSGDDVEYIPYDIYKEFLDEFNIDYIPPLAIIKNPTYESLTRLLEKTGQFLVADGKGNGEGIVIKNYDFYNKYKRQTWAKIVSNEFKETHHKVMGAPELNVSLMVEEKIVDEFVTESFVEKEFAKIINDNDGWQSKFIPMLLSRVFYELINEEMWNIVKKHKNPKIDFRTLNSLVTQKIKQVKREIFS
jgi:hypothetical protein